MLTHFKNLINEKKNYEKRHEIVIFKWMHIIIWYSMNEWYKYYIFMKLNVINNHNIVYTVEYYIFFIVTNI